VACTNGLCTDIGVWLGVFLLHGAARLVAGTDVSNKLSLAVGYRSEHATRNHIALGCPEPQPDLVEPRGVGRSELQVNLRMRCQEALDRRSLVSRDGVGNHVKPFAPGLADDARKEGDEPRGCVPLGGLTQQLAALRVEGGMARL
jgi:hypothetical protein